MSEHTHKPGDSIQDGRVAECALIPCGNTNLQLTAEQPSIGECWIPSKNDTLNPRVKEKHQQDGRMGEILFRIKLYSCQRCTEGPPKLCGHQDPRKGEVTPTRDRVRQAFECLSVSCRGMGHQSPAWGQGLWVQQTWEMECVV